MNGRASGLLVIGAAAGVLAASGPARAQLISPGDLSEAHASLGGDDDCSSCHARGEQVVAEKCLTCHRPLAARIGARAGLHGRAYRDRGCASCHIEHLGRSARLIRWPGGAMERLDHRETGWPLAGAHARARCSACHRGRTGTGRATFLGAPAACAGCHQDPHRNRFGAGCDGCHDAGAWKRVDLRGFDHARARFPLRGKHAEAACEGCHGRPPRYQGVAFDTCGSCHQDPHAGRYAQPCQTCHVEEGWQGAGAREQARRTHPGLSLAGGHRDLACQRCHDRGNQRAPSRGRDCADCHPPVHEARLGARCERCHASIRWLGLPRSTGLAAHDQTPYPLAGAHRQVACERCHPRSRPPAARFRRLEFDRCAACHADRHAGEFAARGRGECGDCHDAAGFAPARFGVERHASTAFALDGRHQAAPCAGCHPGARPRLVWRQPKRRCAECHADPHGGEFAAELGRGGCAECHTTRSWDEPKVDHSSFPLTGAHARAGCVRCHGRPGGAGAARYRGVPRECEGCHEDAHAGQFRSSAPVRGCGDCHSTERFTGASRFDHAGQAGFALEQKHRPLACAACHPRTALRGGARAVRYRLGYRRCRDCHASPHRELAATGRAGAAGGLSRLECSDCHGAGGWRVPAASDRAGRFDHDRTGFPLRGAHRAASCAGCHGGAARPRAECGSCHADPHARRLGAGCAECHRATTWSDTSVLERHRRSRLPLTGRHALLDCTACHRQGERGFSAAPAECYACHAADYRRPGIHPDHDGDASDPASEPLPRECGQCHRTGGWSPAVVDPGSLGWAVRALGRAPDRHDDRFLLSSGPHRGAACDDCHEQGRDGRRVRCAGCHAHDPIALRRQHRGRAVAPQGASCLTCHPRGLAR